MAYVPDDSRYVRIVFNCRAGVPIFLKIRKISPVDQTINDKHVIWQYFLLFCTNLENMAHSCVTKLCRFILIIRGLYIVKYHVFRTFRAFKA